MATTTKAVKSASTEKGPNTEKSEVSELVDVVVLHGRIIHHDGRKIKHSEQVALPELEAARLKKLGFVEHVSDIKAKLAAANGVTISYDSAGSSVTITRGG